MTDAESTRVPFPNKDCYDYIIANGFERGSNLANKLMAYAEWGWDEALKRHLAVSKMTEAETINRLKEDISMHARVADKNGAELASAKEYIKELEAEVERRGDRVVRFGVALERIDKLLASPNPLVKNEIFEAREIIRKAYQRK
jgi:2-methylisocitrate lyase-like PEP mutase family enzyme